jgi:hypothetical protein
MSVLWSAFTAVRELLWAYSKVSMLMALAGFIIPVFAMPWWWRW